MLQLNRFVMIFSGTEWNGTYSHDPSNNHLENWPNINGVDDYLHQAADSANWPKGIIYDPDNSGKPISSLGVHEHWNNPVNKQYSRNLGKSYGIELISIPANITGPNAPKMVATNKYSCHRMQLQQLTKICKDYYLNNNRCENHFCG